VNENLTEVLVSFVPEVRENMILPCATSFEVTVKVGMLSSCAKAETDRARNAATKVRMRIVIDGIERPGSGTLGK
jgi:hypothetical protein